MGELYDPIKAKQISQSFNGATGTQGIQAAAATINPNSTAIDRRLKATVKSDE